MPVILLLAALLAADAGQDATSPRPSVAQAEAAYLRAVQDLALARAALGRARTGPERAAATARVDQLVKAIDDSKTDLGAAQAALRAEKDEQKRRDDAAGERFAAEAAARASDPRWAVPVLSAAICQAKTRRAEAKTAIAEERKYARVGGGVVDMRAIYEAQQRMRDADQSERWARAALRPFKKSPLPCSSTLVADLSDCILDIPSPQDAQCWPLREHVAVYDHLIR